MVIALASTAGNCLCNNVAVIRRLRLIKESAVLLMVSRIAWYVPNCLVDGEEGFETRIFVSMSLSGQRRQFFTRTARQLACSYSITSKTSLPRCHDAKPHSFLSHSPASKIEICPAHAVSQAQKDIDQSEEVWFVPT